MDKKTLVFMLAYTFFLNFLFLSLDVNAQSYIFMVPPEEGAIHGNSSTSNSSSSTSNTSENSTSPSVNMSSNATTSAVNVTTSSNITNMTTFSNITNMTTLFNLTQTLGNQTLPLNQTSPLILQITFLDDSVYNFTSPKKIPCPPFPPPLFDSHWSISNNSHLFCYEKNESKNVKNSFCILYERGTKNQFSCHFYIKGTELSMSFYDVEPLEKQDSFVVTRDFYKPLSLEHCKSYVFFYINQKFARILCLKDNYIINFEKGKISSYFDGISYKTYDVSYDSFSVSFLTIGASDPDADLKRFVRYLNDTRITNMSEPAQLAIIRKYDELTAAQKKALPEGKKYLIPEQDKPVSLYFLGNCLIFNEETLKTNSFCGLSKESVVVINLHTTQTREFSTTLLKDIDKPLPVQIMIYDNNVFVPPFLFPKIGSTIYVDKEKISLETSKNVNPTSYISYSFRREAKSLSICSYSTKGQDVGGRLYRDRVETSSFLLHPLLCNEIKIPEDGRALTLTFLSDGILVGGNKKIHVQPNSILTININSYIPPEEKIRTTIYVFGPNMFIGTIYEKEGNPLHFNINKRGFEVYTIDNSSCCLPQGRSIKLSVPTVFLIPQGANSTGYEFEIGNVYIRDENSPSVFLLAPDNETSTYLYLKNSNFIIPSQPATNVGLTGKTKYIFLSVNKIKKKEKPLVEPTEIKKDFPQSEVNVRIERHSDIINRTTQSHTSDVGGSVSDIERKGIKDLLPNMKRIVLKFKDGIEFIDVDKKVKDITLRLSNGNEYRIHLTDAPEQTFNIPEEFSSLVVNQTSGESILITETGIKTYVQEDIRLRQIIKNKTDIPLKDKYFEPECDIHVISHPERNMIELRFTVQEFGKETLLKNVTYTITYPNKTKATYFSETGIVFLKNPEAGTYTVQVGERSKVTFENVIKHSDITRTLLFIVLLIFLLLLIYFIAKYKMFKKEIKKTDKK